MSTSSLLVLSSSGQPSLFSETVVPVTIIFSETGVLVAVILSYSVTFFLSRFQHGIEIAATRVSADGFCASVLSAARIAFIFVDTRGGRGDAPGDGDGEYGFRPDSSMSAGGIRDCLDSAGNRGGAIGDRGDAPGDRGDAPGDGDGEKGFRPGASMAAGGSRTCLNAAVGRGGVARDRDDASGDWDGENGFRISSVMDAEVELDRGDIAGDVGFESGRTFPGNDEHCSTSLRNWLFSIVNALHSCCDMDNASKSAPSRSLKICVNCSPVCSRIFCTKYNGRLEHELEC